MDPKLEIGLLGLDEPTDAFARAVARAFVGYPVMNHTFADSPGPQEEWIFKMVSRSARARQAAGAKIPLVRCGDRVAAGAYIQLPGFRLRTEDRNWFEEFLTEAGPAAISFFPRMVELIEAVVLPEPHVYLTMIGVDPEFQGQGIGKALIESVVDIARAIPECKGVGLDTEDEKNVRIYRACGFEVVDQTSLDGMPIYVMWRAI